MGRHGADIMRADIEGLLGACRSRKGSRFYYDCPRCKTKDPTGHLVVNWDEDKFVCNHVDSCGFAGNISVSLGFELGIKNGKKSTFQPPVDEPMPIYKIGQITPVTFEIEKDKDKYIPINDRIRQIRALFDPSAQLVTCIDSQYGNLISMPLEELEYAPENHTHFKVNAGGAKAEDIKDYKYSLVECDDIADLKIQGAYITQLGLPVASLTYSGNKSLHAVIKINADTLDEFKRRVELVHYVCLSVGFKIDKTKDCCRFTRLAGSINNKTGRIQRLLDINIGARDWNEWESIYLPKLLVTENVLSSFDIRMREIMSGFSSGFATHDYNDSGLKGGDVTLLTGKRNQGKTTFSRQLVMACALQGIRSFVWYGEGDKEVEKGYLVRLIARKDEIRHADNGFGRTVFSADDKAEARFDEHYSHYVDMYVKPIALPVPVFDDLISRMTDKARVGARLFVIDNMMKLTADQKNTFDAQKMIISRLKEFAVFYNVHIVLIAHPRKGDGNQSVSGAMEQENTADTILRFMRVAGRGHESMSEHEKAKITAVVINEKVRNDGKEHIMYFEFDNTRQANVEIAYLDDLEFLANDYIEGGMYSRFHQVCEDEGGKTVNGAFVPNNIDTEGI